VLCDRERGNPDDDPQGENRVSIKTIYEPKGEAREYAALATNPYRGCGHGCAYCYVPFVTKQDRREFNAGAVERTDYLVALHRQAKRLHEKGITGQVLLSFTSDPYPPGSPITTRYAIMALQFYGFSVCTLTKGGTRAIRDIDLFRPKHDAFACTLTSLDDEVSKKWEPNAALPDDRIDALWQFHERGIYTWVSLEPTLDCDAALLIVRETHGFVDHYKIGRANYLPMTKTTDWRAYTLRMAELCQRLGVKHYFKLSLQGYLPDGYENTMPEAQHH
jgi:hypothetical protein